MVGGGMRQTGILAAAGIFALTNNVERLAEDHARALRLAKGIAAAGGERVTVDPVQTNMVFVELSGVDPKGRASKLAERGILILPGNPLRLVTHLDIGEEDVDRIITAFGEVLAG
jgi:threonine aldolase